jgi:hypothetical protein
MITLGCKPLLRWCHEDIRVLATFVAFAGLLIALIAAGFGAWQASLLRIQLKYQNQVDAAAFYQKVSQATTELERIFVTYPQLRPHFYDNQECKDHLQRCQLLALAALVADAAEVCVTAEVFMPHMRGDWDDYFGFLYQNSPALREYWADFGHLYPPDVSRTFLGPSLRPKAWPTGPRAAK